MKPYRMSARRTAIAGFFIITVVLLAGCDMISGGGSADTGPNEVSMEGSEFVPEELTVEAGATVTWTNNDSVTHTVTAGTRGSPTGLFDFRDVSAGESVTFTFETTGAYEYYCELHPGMSGTIVVE